MSYHIANSPHAMFKQAKQASEQIVAMKADMKKLKAELPAEGREGLAEAVAGMETKLAHVRKTLEGIKEKEGEESDDPYESISENECLLALCRHAKTVFIAQRRH
ncbi:hypothetical protein E8E11_001172 [Didymella keratinophila]|nr:hypothetical protein E8E11_001172 [Didymella keratinophila]